MIILAYRAERPLGGIEVEVDGELADEEDNEDEDDASSTVSNVSDFSCLSDMSGHQWKAGSKILIDLFSKL